MALPRSKQKSPALCSTGLFVWYQKNIPGIKLERILVSKFSVQLGKLSQLAFIMVSKNNFSFASFAGTGKNVVSKPIFANSNNLCLRGIVIYFK